MYATVISPQNLAPWRRIVAAIGAALVLALTIFAASPTAHDLLHDHAHGHNHGVGGGEGCAVTMFADGVSMPVGPVSLAPPRLLPHGVTPATAAEIFLVSPRYLRHPERGPPVSLVG